jgi:hypothetical protein
MACFDGVIYCKPHFKQLFKARGKYDDLSPRLSGKNGAIAGEVKDGE